MKRWAKRRALTWLLTTPAGWGVLAVLLVTLLAATPLVLFAGLAPPSSAWDLLPPEATGGDPAAYGPPPGYTPPEAIRFREVDQAALVGWLARQGSYLARPEYVSEFVEAGRQFDIDPRLLVAITGAEQSFVPAGDPQAARIAQNPFNVFGCWCTTSIGFQRSARIAAATVARLSQDRPPGMDAVAWLAHPGNPRGMYAVGRENAWRPRPTSPAWTWIGNVSRFFAQLRAEVPAE